MGKTIRLKKGFDINLAGKAALTISDTEQPETFAIKPTDFHGIYLPKVMVKEGDTVKVKLIGVDHKTGKFKLSRKALMPKPDFAPRNAPQQREGKPGNDAN